MSILTNYRPWKEVQEKFMLDPDDLVFCFMKCSGYRGGRAEDQDWVLVKHFKIVRFADASKSKELDSEDFVYPEHGSWEPDQGKIK